MPAGLDDLAQIRKLLPEPGNPVDELVVNECEFRPGVPEDVSDPLVVLPRIDGDEGRSDEKCGEILDDGVRVVERDRGNAVPPGDPRRLEEARRPAGLFVEFPVGKLGPPPAVAVEDEEGFFLVGLRLV